MNNDLKELSNPKKFHKPIVIKDENSDFLKSLLKSMIMIRKTEEQLAYGRKENLIGSYNIKNQNNPGNICKPVNQNLANGKPIFPQQGTHPYQVTYACHVCMPRYMPRMNACMKKLYIFSGIFIFSETG